jgi:hypothetical protein
MWPFSSRKKEEDELAAFEKELGLRDNIGVDRVSEPKEEPTSFDNLAAPKDESSIELRKSYEMQRNQVQSQQFPQNDSQIISAKLDTIKAMLDLINQRLNTIERNVEEKQKQKLW